MISRRGLHTSLILIPTIGLLAITGARADQCRLSGKSITIDVVVCPNRETSIGPDCTRGRIRYSILKNNVLEFSDEVTPRGIVFEMNKTVDVTEHMVGSGEVPNTYIKASATASYSNGQLRLLKERRQYLNAGTLVGTLAFLTIIEVVGDCSRCSVSRYHIDAMITVPGKPEHRNIELLAKQMCEIREGG